MRVHKSGGINSKIIRHLGFGKRIVHITTISSRPARGSYTFPATRPTPVSRTPFRKLPRGEGEDENLYTSVGASHILVVVAGRIPRGTVVRIGSQLSIRHINTRVIFYRKLISKIQILPRLIDPRISRLLPRGRRRTFFGVTYFPYAFEILSEANRFTLILVIFLLTIFGVEKALRS